MGTETIQLGISMQQSCSVVKLNNPLMGTETYNVDIVFHKFYLRKLN